MMAVVLLVVTTHMIAPQAHAVNHPGWDESVPCRPLIYIPLAARAESPARRLIK